MDELLSICRKKNAFQFYRHSYYFDQLKIDARTRIIENSRPRHQHSNLYKLNRNRIRQNHNI